MARLAIVHLHKLARQVRFLNSFVFAIHTAERIVDLSRRSEVSCLCSQTRYDQLHAFHSLGAAPAYYAEESSELSSALFPSIWRNHERDAPATALLEVSQHSHWFPKEYSNPCADRLDLVAAFKYEHVITKFMMTSLNRPDSVTSMEVLDAFDSNVGSTCSTSPRAGAKYTLDFLVSKG